jgi:hypothetical protein
LHEGLFISGDVFNSVECFLLVLVLLEEMRKIFIKTNLEEGLFKKCPLDGLIKLKVDVFPDYVSKPRGTVIRMDVLLLFLHLNVILNLNQLKNYIILKIADLSLLYASANLENYEIESDHVII